MDYTIDCKSNHNGSGVVAYVPSPSLKRKRAPRRKKSMTLRDKAAQLVIVVSNGDVLSTKSAEHEKYRHWVRDLHVGGIIVNNTAQYGVVRNAEPHAMAVFLNQMQRLSKVPLLVASDFERGASMRVGGGTRFPHSMAFGAAGDLAASRYEGLITAREARAKAAVLTVVHDSHFRVSRRSAS